MPSFQYRELLAKNEVFDKQPVTTVEESEDRTRQEYKRVYHVRVLSHFACGRQRRVLLKSQGDRILARHSRIDKNEDVVKAQNFPGVWPGRQVKR